MGKINIGRVILGGIVAGIVGDILGFLVDGVMLAPQWSAGMRALGKSDFSASQNVGFTIVGLAFGILVVWLYAAIRPRLGAGPKSAVYAGVAAWAMGILLPNLAFMAVAGLFASSLITMTTAAGLVEWVLAALAGAALYKEGAESVRSMQARA